jgi:predicted nucleic acid-binding protein
VSIGLRAGQLDGHNQASGVKVPLADLLVGVTALELGYGVGTANLRRFRRVTGLSVTRCTRPRRPKGIFRGLPSWRA